MLPELRESSRLSPNPKTLPGPRGTLRTPGRTPDLSEPAAGMAKSATPTTNTIQCRSSPPGPYKASHNLSLNALRRTTRRIIRGTTPLILTLLPVSTNNITAATRIAVVQVQLTAVIRIPIAVTEAVEAGESARSLHAG